MDKRKLFEATLLVALCALEEAQEKCFSVEEQKIFNNCSLRIRDMIRNEQKDKLNTSYEDVLNEVKDLGVKIYSQSM